MDRYILDLTNYLQYYPRISNESDEDYRDRIDICLLEDYSLDVDTRRKILDEILKKTLDKE